MMSDTSATWIYDDYAGTSTATTSSYTDGMLWVNSASSSDTYTYRILKNRDNYIPSPAPVSSCAVEYDPEKKKFIVHRGLEHQPKEFTSKRSALKYVKRWEGGRTKKVDTIKKLKARNEENKIRIAEEERRAREHAYLMERLRIQAEERRERMRLEAEARELELERLELENDEENYFERLGL